MKINLKDFRQSHKLFQSDMAELLEVNQSNISRAEIRGYFDLSFLQKKKLFDRFGEDDVMSFAIGNGGDHVIDAEQMSVSASGNVNEGDGTQNNGYFEANSSLISIIGRQSDALMRLAEKQMEQTDRIVELLKKLSDKV